MSGAPVVVDFEGPRDFLRGPGGPGDVRPVGSAVLRRRQLRWFGYEVVSAPMRNWAGRGPVGFSSKGGRGSLNSDMPLTPARGMDPHPRPHPRPPTYTFRTALPHSYTQVSKRISRSICTAQCQWSERSCTTSSVPCDGPVLANSTRGTSGGSS